MFNRTIKCIAFILAAVTALLCFAGCSQKEETTVQIASTPQEQITQSVLEYPGKNEDFRYDVYTYYVEISQCLSTKTNIIIPDTIENLPVYSIKAGAFKNQTTFSTVNMTNNIISIGDSAFYGCKNLTSIKFSDNLETLGASALSNCESLKNITFPKGLLNIPSNVCSGCKRLSYCVLPEADKKFDANGLEIPTQKVVGSSAFSGCTSLKMAWLPGDVATVNDGAFSGSEENLIIYGTDRSSAARYASTHFIDFGFVDSSNLQKLVGDLDAREVKSLNESFVSPTWKITLDKTCVYQGNFDYSSENIKYTETVNPDECVVVMCFTVNNTAGSQKEINYFDFDVTVDGYKRRVSTYGTIANKSIDKYPCPLLKTLENEEVFCGYIAVKIPKDWTSIKVAYRNDFNLENSVFKIDASDVKIEYTSSFENGKDIDGSETEGKSNDKLSAEDKIEKIRDVIGDKIAEKETAENITETSETSTAATTVTSKENASSETKTS